MFDIDGKIVTILAEQTGTGKNGVWTKRDFVIETNEQYPEKLCLSAWGDKGDILKVLDNGASVKVTFVAESREFNGKWYTDLKVWKIDNDKSGGSRTTDNSQAAVSEPTFNATTEDPAGDLPF
jgi:hypothetical protein